MLLIRTRSQWNFKGTLFNLTMYLGIERANTAMLNPSAVIWVVSQIHLIVGFHLQHLILPWSAGLKTTVLIFPSVNFLHDL